MNSKNEKKNHRWIGVSIGEISGDQRFSSLFDFVKEQNQNCSFEGTGGLASISKGLTSWTKLEDMAAYGLKDVLVKLPFYLRLLKKWENSFKENPPKFLILVDFADFNLRLLKIAQKFNIPVKWLAPPQMWAWRAERKQFLKEVSLGCLFEFENELYKKWGLNSECLGFEKQSQFVFDENGPIGLFAGSRMASLKKQLPLLINVACDFIKQNKLNSKVVVVLPNEYVVEKVKSNAKIKALKLEVEWVVIDKVKVLSKAFTIPGTITLELALNKIPLDVVYQGSKLQKRFLNKHISLSSFSLPNILTRSSHYSETYFIKFEAKTNPLRKKWSKDLAFTKSREFKENPVHSSPLDEMKILADDPKKSINRWLFKKIEKLRKLK